MDDFINIPIKNKNCKSPNLHNNFLHIPVFKLFISTSLLSYSLPLYYYYLKDIKEGKKESKKEERKSMINIKSKKLRNKLQEENYMSLIDV